MKNFAKVNRVLLFSSEQLQLRNEKARREIICFYTVYSVLCSDNVVLITILRSSQRLISSLHIVISCYQYHSVLAWMTVLFLKSFCFYDGNSVLRDEYKKSKRKT